MDPKAPPPTSPAPGRPLPALGFLLALLGLAVVAFLTLRARPRIITGLPEGPAALQMRATLANRLSVDTGGLRLQASLLGDDGDDDARLANAAERAVLAAIRERPRDPRLHAALAFVELAAHQSKDAERSYREALDLAPSYGEARLGLGMTLALRAQDERDAGRQRGLELKAISQFASVPEADPCYAAALYDRVLLLARVGRAEEARHWAKAYLARDPGSAWAITVMREVPGAKE
ncbi:MAG: hypothetical protein E6K81_15680 [Candidatus Eisenbacteria bacterium]|uniref:Tetratricopeptide repeat protein n=1 Tax=Eiseniibacteriota bacterium TaxID=2212470 RepID=A0A538TZP5_UNCEI|nr:MAG: hypothetical protein E6K81_15680 [Candidatus Eisenbacteria bacterium]